MSLFLFNFRVLCEIVKDFVSKVGAASASSDPEEAREPGSLAQKVRETNNEFIEWEG
jgi:hypothetical protein